MNRSLPFFSIIIPTYNRPKQLVFCLQSLARQNYPRGRMEVIVIDDGSRSMLDDTMGKFKNSFELSLIRQSNLGPAAARNNGAIHAKGEYLAFTDDDCIPSENWLRVFANQIVATPRCMVGGKIVNTLTDNVYGVTSQMILDIVYRHYNQDLKQARFFTACNMAVPAKPFLDLGGFNQDFRISEDREFCDRWLRHGNLMIFTPTAIVCHNDFLNRLGSFYKRYFSYGRGAYRFHKARADDGAVTMLNEFKLHTNIRNWLFYPFIQGKCKQPFILSVLLILWQVANAAGFLYEAINQKLKKQP